jgi:hypothetical protein
MRGVLFPAGASASAKPIQADAHATTDTQPDDSTSQAWSSSINSAYAADGIMSSFLDMVRSMFGSDQPAAKTVAELADNAPGNVSMLVNGVKRAELQTVIGDPNWEATIFCPTNRVRGYKRKPLRKRVRLRIAYDSGISTCLTICALQQHCIVQLMHLSMPYWQ